ncbi:hypothetical protein CPB86DRAFT_714055 [Serendipita vermifera]|nr:hypothetical protein CPB86DRAFT_714055 [Serendipita vermifera]
MSFQADSSIVAGQLRIAYVLLLGFHVSARVFHELPADRAAFLPIFRLQIVWTIPAEHIFYKGATAPKKTLLVATRYLGIAALVANCALYFSSYDGASCRSVHLLPGILQCNIIAFLFIIYTEC